MLSRIIGLDGPRIHGMVGGCGNVWCPKLEGMFVSGNELGTSHKRHRLTPAWSVSTPSGAFNTICQSYSTTHARKLVTVLSGHFYPAFNFTYCMIRDGGQVFVGMPTLRFPVVQELLSPACWGGHTACVLSVLYFLKLGKPPRSLTNRMRMPCLVHALLRL